jgi:DNA adenine methylase
MGTGAGVTSLMPYIGGKHRIAGQIAQRLRATGADTLCDVFGGSAAVTLNAGFSKRIYNDLSGDLYCLMTVLADPERRRQLIKRLRWTTPSRRLYLDDYALYVSGGFSFCGVADPIERAAKVFYRHHYSFGGKTRSGGFSVSTGDRHGIKEAIRFRNVLRRLVRIGEFLRSTVIENLDYSEIVSMYGRRANVVLFVDPPYVGTERYYSGVSTFDHVFLAQQLDACACPVVATYYDCELIRALYPSCRWTIESVIATKNSQFRGGQKQNVGELIMTKRAA